MTDAALTAAPVPPAALTNSRRTAALAGLGAVLAAITVVQALLHARVAPDVDGYRRLIEFVLLWLAAGGVYALALAFASRAGGRATVVVVVACAALMRVAPLASTPFLSTDLYRYVWDGRVQAAGLNPYCCIPSAPELAGLRDATIYPMINRSDYAPTIYPPFAQAFFALVAQVAPSLLGFKLAMLAAEAVAIAAMAALLHHRGLPIGRLAIFAWHPLAVWEIAGSGHVDALAIAGIGLALLAASVPDRRQGLAGVALAAAAITKFLPGVIGPALWDWRGRAGWTMPAAVLATIAAFYAAYASVGWGVFGFLGGYAGEEGLGSGGGIVWLQMLATLTPLPAWAGRAWLALAACAIAALAVRSLVRPRTPERMATDALVLATALTVAITPHYAWYFLWLAYLACLTPSLGVILLTIACMAAYIDPFHTDMRLATAIYAPFIVLTAVELGRAARARRA